jgi:oligoendopeptidase F
MSVFFPALDAPEFDNSVARLDESLSALEGRFDALGVGKKTGPTTDEDVYTFDELLPARNQLSDDLRFLNAYIAGFTTTDSRDAFALGKDSEMDGRQVRFRKLGKRFTAWLGSLDPDFLLDRSQLARDHEYVLRRAREAAEHLMEPDLESLASDLEVTGMIAWGKLHGNVTSRLEVKVGHGEDARAIPMSMVRSIAYDSARPVRKAGYTAELDAWKQVETPLSAAMNSIKGEVGMLSLKRGWASPLDEALFASNIDRQTLDAMLGAARSSFPIFRRYLKAKAKLLALPQLSFYDLFAPVGAEARSWEYDERLLPEARGVCPAKLSGKLDRCRISPRQTGWRLLHGGEGRYFSHPYELQTVLWLGKHPGSRAGPWVSQPVSQR